MALTNSCLWMMEVPGWLPEDMLEEAAVLDPSVAVLSLSRNFGHQAALTAALDYVTGDAVVLMDGDLQDAPEAIPLFVERYKEGYDVVYAMRAAREESLSLRLCYFLFLPPWQAMLSDTPVPSWIPVISPSCPGVWVKRNSSNAGTASLHCVACGVGEVDSGRWQFP